MENSNLTRRSFIKKSSYSAAAVTVLGTGVALAHAGTSGNPLRWERWETEVFADKTVTITTTEEWDPNDSGDRVFMRQALMNAMTNSSHGDNFTTSIEDSIVVTYTHDHGGALKVSPPFLSFDSGEFKHDYPQGTYDPVTKKYTYVFTVESGYTFTLLKTHRES